MFNTPDAFTLIGGLTLVGLLPFITVMATSFVKISIIFVLIRNALGVQQAPPNMAMNGLALVLTIFIMAPVAYECHQIALELGTEWENSTEAMQGIGHILEPYRQFLLNKVSQTEVDFFADTAKQLWPPEHRDIIDNESFLVLIPAYTVSELTSAFEVGFILYLPFIAIDLIVSNILLAMGMMMVSPMTISLPFKLLLFVLLDGWTRLTHGIVLSYQIG
ncbi:EscR/YscR/HrcR family type III secretion system export apparatus protein [Vibrio zhanjiangensis]|uniref:EscR/YscR/HrcR family type III secretion system export apparatus protein n=1 Tax=Vibrio zhanjiangensis TaxID=1046128 RepID=A0ABQ6EX90_9VIBR|nr:type III secretion system export apparatus subunit SctR [Vibrio zhanjiangensis]GLT17815.1 EscR/YscR/HrcR family type III secretion system export apparatus protein [Vibrio zhanjiangensis]